MSQTVNYNFYFAFFHSPDRPHLVENTRLNVVSCLYYSITHIMKIIASLNCITELESTHPTRKKRKVAETNQKTEGQQKARKILKVSLEMIK